MRRALPAVLVLLFLAACAPLPPSAMDLYRDDLARQGNAASDAPAQPGTVSACDLVEIARLPIEVQDHLLTVPVAVNGKWLRLIVDTGAQRTTISLNAAQRLGMTVDFKRLSTSTGIGGSTTLPDAVVNRFVIGDKNLPQMNRVAVGRFGFEGSPNLTAEGLLGADVLLAFDLDIDVPGKALTLYRVRRCIDSEPPWKEPFVRVQGVTTRVDRLLIPFQLDGTPGMGILDTGAQATTIGVRMATRMGLNEDSMALDRKVVSRGAGAGTMTARLHWFHELRVGPAAVQGLMLTVLPSDAGVGDALIGEDFLEGRRVWMSFPTRQMFVSKLSHESAAR